jgi:hypothetical protein
LCAHFAAASGWLQCNLDPLSRLQIKHVLLVAVTPGSRNVGPSSESDGIAAAAAVRRSAEPPRRSSLSGGPGAPRGDSLAHGDSDGPPLSTGSHGGWPLKPPKTLSSPGEAEECGLLAVYQPQAPSRESSMRKLLVIIAQWTLESPSC